MSEIDDLFALFGRFISNFAAAESAMRSSLVGLTGASFEAGKILCEGLRNDDLIKRLKSLIEISDYDPDDKEVFLRLIEQFLIISKLRNDLIHKNSVAIDADSFFVSDSMRKIPQQFKILRSEIEAADGDLTRIWAGVMAISVKKSQGQFGNPAFYDERYTWRYKPA